MIKNNSKPEEIQKIFLNKEQRLIQFYEYDFQNNINNNILQELINHVILQRQIIRIQFMNCINLTQNDLIELFSGLEQNNNLKKFKISWTDDNIMNEKEYNDKLYSKLYNNSNLSTIYAPSYNIYNYAFSNLFNNNQNLNKIVLSSFEKKLYKTYIKFMSQIKKPFKTLKIDNAIINDSEMNQIKELSQIIKNNLEFKILKINRLQISNSQIDQNYLNMLFFNQRIEEIYIKVIILCGIKSVELFISHLNSIPNIKTIRINSFGIQQSNNQILDFNNIAPLPSSISIYELGITPFQGTNNFTKYIQNTNNIKDDSDYDSNNNKNYDDKDNDKNPNENMMNNENKKNSSNLIEFYHRQHITQQLCQTIIEMKKIERLKIYIDDINVFEQLFNNLPSTLKSIRITFLTQFLDQLFIIRSQSNHIKTYCQPQSQQQKLDNMLLNENKKKIKCKFILLFSPNREQLSNFKITKQVAQYFTDIIKNNNEDKIFSITIPYQYSFLLELLIGQQYLEQPNFYQIISSYPLIQYKLDECRTIPILQFIVYQKFIKENLIFSPDQTYFDLYF